MRRRAVTMKPANGGGVSMFAGFGSASLSTNRSLALPPVNFTPPEIEVDPPEGDAAVGATLTVVSPGDWSGSPTFTYQWRRDGVDISGETAIDYVAVVADSTKLISVRVTATNAAGSQFADSNDIEILFVPESLTGLKNHWTAKDLISVGDFNPIDSWTSRVGALVLPVTQGDNARPIFVLDYYGDGNLGVIFDGIDDNFRPGAFAATDLFDLSSWELWVQLRQDTNVGRAFRVFGAAGTVSLQPQDGVIKCFYGPAFAELVEVSQPGGWLDVRNVIRIRKSGSLLEISANGSVIGSGPVTGDFINSTFNSGANDVGLLLEGAYYDILTISGNLTSGEAANLWGYLPDN